MPTYQYFVVYNDLKKRDQPRHPKRFDLCPITGEVLENVVLMEASPVYPQLADGLEIGAVYEYKFEESSWYRDRSKSGYHVALFCEALVKLITGKELDGTYKPFDWCDELSGLVERHGPWSESEGKGPFWEFLRFGLRCVPFGPVACRKLAADFDKWEPYAWSLGDFQFYEFYRMMRKCFGSVKENGAVFFPNTWYDGNGRKYTEPRLGSDPIEVEVYEVEPSLI
ncbi:hypothetical protein [Cupriavidus sp. 8B]